MINWKEQSEDDFIAIEGDYMLRVLLLSDEDWYWWKVSYKGEEIKCGNALHIITAREFAKQAMNKHLKLK